MVKRALLVQIPLRNVVIAANQSLMTIDDFDAMMTDLVVFSTCLATLKEVTVRIQADKYSTITSAINHYLTIKNNLKHISSDVASNMRTKGFARVLLGRLQQRLGAMMKTGLPLCGAALDLRYCHQVPTVSRPQLVQDMTSYTIDLRTACKATINRLRIEAEIPELLDLVIKGRKQLTDNNTDITSEHTRQFWSCSLSTSDDDNGLITIYRNVAQMIMSVPVTSASSERVFSHAGFIQNKKRCRISKVCRKKPKDCERADLRT